MEYLLRCRRHCNLSTNIDDHFHGNFPMFSLFIVHWATALGAAFYDNASLSIILSIGTMVWLSCTSHVHFLVHWNAQSNRFYNGAKQVGHCNMNSFTIQWILVLRQRKYYSYCIEWNGAAHIAIQLTSSQLTHSLSQIHSNNGRMKIRKAHTSCTREFSSFFSSLQRAIANKSEPKKQEVIYNNNKNSKKCNVFIIFLFGIHFYHY